MDFWGIGYDIAKRSADCRSDDCGTDARVAVVYPVAGGQFEQPSDGESRMTERTTKSRTGHRWYTRPVLFVADVNRAIRFYVERLGFEKNWHEGDGAGTVCQVTRRGCEIILCEDAARCGRARLFVELTREGLAELRRELAERSVPSKDSWWGHAVIQVDDPDGNELLFPTTP